MWLLKACMIFKFFPLLLANICDDGCYTSDGLIILRYPLFYILQKHSIYWWSGSPVPTKKQIRNTVHNCLFTQINYLLLQVDCDKNMHACWDFDATSVQTRKGECIRQASKFKSKCIICNKYDPSKYTEVKSILLLPMIQIVEVDIKAQGWIYG